MIINLNLKTFIVILIVFIIMICVAIKYFSKLGFCRAKGADVVCLLPHASQWNLPDTVEPAIEKSQKNIVLNLICIACTIYERVIQPIPTTESLRTPFKSESEDSIDGESVYSEFRSAVFFSFFQFRASLIRTTLSFNCVQVQTLPIAQDTPVLTDFFFAGL